MTSIWVNIGSGNRLVPSGTWTSVDSWLVRSSENHLQAISQKIPRPVITKIMLKIIYLKFHWNHPCHSRLNDNVILHIAGCQLEWNINSQKDTPYLMTSYGVHLEYCKISNIRHTSAGNKLVDHSDVAGTLLVGTAPITSSFSTHHLAPVDWAKTTAGRNKKHLSLGIWCILY